MRCLFQNFYRNCKPCSGILANDGDPKGKEVPDWSDMEVPSPPPPPPVTYGAMLY